MCARQTESAHRSEVEPWCRTWSVDAAPPLKSEQSHLFIEAMFEERSSSSSSSGGGSGSLQRSMEMPEYRCLVCAACVSAVRDI